MSYPGDGRLPVIYVRGFAGGPSGIDNAVGDPFYGFNEGSVQVARRRRRPAGRSTSSRARCCASWATTATSSWCTATRRRTSASRTPARCPRRRSGCTGSTTSSRRCSPRTRTRSPSSAPRRSLLELVAAGAQADRRAAGVPRRALDGRPRRARHAAADASPTTRASAARSTPPPAFVDRVFTYATPHGGIEFAVGFGLLEKMRDATGLQGADIFGPARMKRVPDADEGRRSPRRRSTRPGMPAGGFPHDRLLLPRRHQLDRLRRREGLSAKAVGPRSDGLVQIDNAYVRGHARARSCTAATRAGTASSTPRRATRTCAGSCSATSRSSRA